jgi:hypothetical protein
MNAALKEILKSPLPEISNFIQDVCSDGTKSQNSAIPKSAITPFPTISAVVFIPFSAPRHCMCNGFTVVK